MPGTSRLHDVLASRGRNGDTIVAHISEPEAKLLKDLGGSGTINPDTGMPEYFVTAALGAAAALGGAALSADAQSDAAGARAGAQQEALEVQNRRLDAQLGTRIDARGNVVKYDEETNTWEVIPSPTTQDIIEAQDNETLLQLTEDAARNRRAAERAEGLAGPAYEQSQAEIRELGQPDQYTPEGIEGILTEDALQGVRESFEGAEQGAARTIMRTGGDPYGRTFSDLAEARGDANARARTDAAVRALGLAPELNAQNEDRSRANLASLTPLATGGRVSIGSEGISGRLQNVLSSRQSGADQAFSGLANTALAGAETPGVANQGLNFAGGVGALAGLFENMNFGSGDTSSTASRRRSGNTSTGTGGFGGAFNTNRQYRVL